MANRVDGCNATTGSPRLRELALAVRIVSGAEPAAQELGDRTFTTPPDIAEFPVSNITKP